MIAPRQAKPTVGFVDKYCDYYGDLFAEGRSFEAFKHLHVGMISEAKRKSLPAIAKVVGNRDECRLFDGHVEHSTDASSSGWKNWLNNLRLILLPWVSSNRLQPWLNVFPIFELEQGFRTLMRLMNQF